MTGIGETIALLDGINLAGLAAASAPKREAPLVSAPTEPEKMLLDTDAAFMAYMDDSSASAGTNVSPYFGSTGGSSHEQGLPLIPSSAGLAGGLSESIGMLEGQASLGRRLHRQQPAGFVRDSILTGGSENFYGGSMTGGSSYFPGASLTYSNAGLSAAPTRPASGKKGAGALPDAWLKHHFADESAYQMFVTFAGEAKVRQAFTARRKLQSQANLYFMNERQLMSMLVARQRLFLQQHAPWTRAQVGSIVANASVDAGRARTTTTALSGANNQLAGLEGKIARKLKKGLKVIGKATLAVGKAGASYMTAGASDMVVNAASSALKKKKPAPATGRRPVIGQGSKVAQRRVERKQTRVAQTQSIGRRVGAAFHAGRQPQYTQQSYGSRPVYDNTAPTQGGDYAGPSYSGGAAYGEQDYGGGGFEE